MRRVDQTAVPDKKVLKKIRRVEEMNNPPYLKLAKIGINY